MTLLYRKRQLAAKVESTKGTAETLAAGNAGFHVYDLSWNPDFDKVERDTLRNTFSRPASIIGAKRGVVSGRVELKGSGTVGSAPSVGTLLKICGFKETSATDSVTYSLDTDDTDTDTGTCAVYNDGKCFKIYGARGTGTIALDANNIAFLNFTITGIFHSDTNAAMLSGVSYESTTPPILVNSSTSMFGWSDATFSSLSIDLGTDVFVRSDANASSGLSYAKIGNRNVTGSIDVDAHTISTAIDWFSNMTTPTLGAFTCTLGSTAGNIVTLAGPQIQIDSVSDTERDGISVYQTGISFRTNGSDDDEFTITFT